MLFSIYELELIFYLQQEPVNKFTRRNHRFKGFKMMISVSI